MRAVLLGGVVLTLIGCVDVCTRALTLNETFAERHAACYPKGTLQNSRFDADRCDTSMKSCSRADEEQVQRYLDCVERLPVCTAETKPAFTEAFLSCASAMNQVSAGCFRP